MIVEGGSGWNRFWDGVLFIGGLTPGVAMIMDAYDHVTTVWSNMQGNPNNSFVYTAYTAFGSYLGRIVGVENFSYAWEKTDAVTGEEYSAGWRAAYGVTKTRIKEVKNVKYQHLSTQIKDYIKLAKKLEKMFYSDRSQGHSTLCATPGVGEEQSHSTLKKKLINPNSRRGKMKTVSLAVVRTFSDEEKKYLQKKFSSMCSPVMKGDKKLFDKLCEKIPAFCEEIYQIGKNMVWPRGTTGIDWLDEPVIETPNDCVIFSVGSNIDAYILPIYKSYLPKCKAFHKMVCDVIGEEKYEGGRDSFIRSIWPKTKRTGGIDISRLFNSIITGCFTVEALLKFRDGRFVKEVRELQDRLTKDIWIVHRIWVSSLLQLSRTVFVDFSTDHLTVGYWIDLHSLLE